MAVESVTMTKDNAGVEAVANVPADAVPVWEAQGWKVKPAPKAKAKE